MMLGTELTITDILGYIDQIGTVALLIIAFLGLHRKWWVPGWVYQSCLDRFVKMEGEKNAWRNTALKAGNIATEAFEEYRKSP